MDRHQMIEIVDGVISDALDGGTPADISGAIIDALQKAGALADGWLPIDGDTPRDEFKPIMLGRAGTDEFAPVCTTGWWQEAESDGPDSMGANAGFVDGDYQIFKPSRDFGNPKYFYAAVQPTHWRLMPTPPDRQTEVRA